MKKIIISLSVLLCTMSVAQDRKLTIGNAVYHAFIDENNPNEYRSLNPENLADLQWVTGTNQYIISKNNTYELYEPQGKKLLTIDNIEAIFPALSRYKDYNAVPQLVYIDTEELVMNDYGTYYRYDYRNKKSLGIIYTPKEAENTEYNPAAKTVAYTIGNNLYIANEHTEKQAVTTHTNFNIVAGKAIHRNEFGIQKGIFFSPKGNYIAFYQKDETHVATYPLVDITTTPATLNAIKYPMAGQPSERAAVGIYNLKTKQLSYLNIDTTDEHFLTNLSWSPDEQHLLLAEVNRAQNHFALNRYEVATGNKVNTILEESNPKWVEPEAPAVFLPNSNTELLWLSERNGFMNVYQYNVNGTLTKQITDFKWVVQEILGFDGQAKNFFIVGTGEDPREKHCYKIDLANPKKITPITNVPGTHKVQLSTNGFYLLDSYSSLTIPHNIDLVETNKGKRTRLLTSKNPHEGFAIGTTEFVTLKADDGTTLYAKMHKPKTFDATKKYPVLIYVYGGPHAQEVTNDWSTNTHLWQKVFAENEQYIVFTLDNRGSQNRGFAFESVIHRQLGEVEIKDQLQGVTYLKSLPYVDANRIAVHGWSFGGYMASSLLLRHPDVFRTAVAGGAVTDWKYYEVMYGERYMDTPQENPEGYDKSRVTKYLKNLKRPILFIHGSVDDIVVPQHLLNLTQESIKERDFIEMFIYPMHAHGVRGVDNINLTERIIDYIKKHNK